MALSYDVMSRSGQNGSLQNFEYDVNDHDDAFNRRHLQQQQHHLHQQQPQQQFSQHQFQQGDQSFNSSQSKLCDSSENVPQQQQQQQHLTAGNCYQQQLQNYYNYHHHHHHHQQPHQHHQQQQNYSLQHLPIYNQLHGNKTNLYSKHTSEFENETSSSLLKTSSDSETETESSDRQQLFDSKQDADNSSNSMSKKSRDRRKQQKPVRMNSGKAGDLQNLIPRPDDLKMEGKDPSLDRQSSIPSPDSSSVDTIEDELAQGSLVGNISSNKALCNGMRSSNSPKGHAGWEHAIRSNEDLTSSKMQEDNLSDNDYPTVYHRRGRELNPELINNKKFEEGNFPTDTTRDTENDQQQEETREANADDEKMDKPIFKEESKRLDKSDSSPMETSSPPTQANRMNPFFGNMTKFAENFFMSHFNPNMDKDMQQMAALNFAKQNLLNESILIEGIPANRNNKSPNSENCRSKIFHQDAYCELCDREFCNKYFLKTHKANKHRIFDSSDLSPFGESTFQMLPGMQREGATPIFPETLQSGVREQNLNEDGKNIESASSSPNQTNPESPARFPAKSPIHSSESGDSDDEYNGQEPKKSRLEDSTKSEKGAEGFSPTQKRQGESGYGATDFRTMANFMLNLNPFMAASMGFLPPAFFPGKSPFPGVLNPDKANKSGEQHPKEDKENPMKYIMKDMNFLSPDVLMEAYRKEMYNSFINKAGHVPFFFPGPFANGFGQNFKSPLFNNLEKSAAYEMNGKENQDKLIKLEKSVGQENVCEICKKCMPNKHALALHMVTFHNIFRPLLPPMGDDCSMMDLSRTKLGSKDAGPYGGGHSSAKLVDRVQCDICQKEVCNKYFLKTHKIKVHGCDPASLEQQDDRISKQQSSHHHQPQQNLTFPLEINHLGPVSLPGDNENSLPVERPREEDLLQLGIDPEAYCEICKKEFCNKYFLKTHKQNIHGIKTSTSSNTLSSTSSAIQHNTSTNPFKNDSMNRGQDQPQFPVISGWPLGFNSMPNFNNSPGSNGNIMGSHLGLLTGGGQMNNNTNNSGSKSSSSNSQSIYPLINPLAPSNSNPFLSGVNPLLQMSNNNSIMPGSEGPLGDSLSDKRSWKWKEPVNAMRVMCEICNKVLCNKYFLKTHMIKRHGLNYDTITGQLSSSNSGSTLPGSNNISTVGETFPNKFSSSSAAFPIFSSNKLGYSFPGMNPNVKSNSQPSMNPYLKYNPTSTEPGITGRAPSFLNANIKNELIDKDYFQNSSDEKLGLKNDDFIEKDHNPIALQSVQNNSNTANNSYNKSKEFIEKNKKETPFSHSSEHSNLVMAKTWQVPVSGDFSPDKIKQEELLNKATTANVPPFVKCDHCNSSYPNEPALRIHLMRDHGLEKESNIPRSPMSIHSPTTSNHYSKALEEQAKKQIQSEFGDVTGETKGSNNARHFSSTPQVRHQTPSTPLEQKTPSTSNDDEGKIPDVPDAKSYPSQNFSASFPGGVGHPKIGSQFIYAQPLNSSASGSQDKKNITMQPFLLSESGGQTHFATSLVYLPTLHKVSEPMVVTFSLTPIAQQN